VGTGQEGAVGSRQHHQEGWRLAIEQRLLERQRAGQAQAGHKMPAGGLTCVDDISTLHCLKRIVAAQVEAAAVAVRGTGEPRQLWRRHHSDTIETP
jgi:hypothetical protein